MGFGIEDSNIVEVLAGMKHSTVFGHGLVGLNRSLIGGEL